MYECVFVCVCAPLPGAYLYMQFVICILDDPLPYLPYSNFKLFALILIASLLPRSSRKYTEVLIQLFTRCRAC